MHADRTHAWFTVCVVSEFREERTMDPADFGGPRRHWYRNHTITHHGPLSMRVTTGQARSQTWEHWVQILSPCPCERNLERAGCCTHGAGHAPRPTSAHFTSRPCRRVRLRCTPGGLWHHTRHYRRISTSQRIPHRCIRLGLVQIPNNNVHHQIGAAAHGWTWSQSSPRQRRPTIKCTRARRPRCLGSRRTSNSSRSSRSSCNA